MNVICHALEVEWVGDSEGRRRWQRPDDRPEVIKLEKKILLCRNRE